MGRKQLSGSAKKRNIQESVRKRDASKINILGQFPKWKELVQHRGGSNADLAEHLLEIHDRFCVCRQQPTEVGSIHSEVPFQAANVDVDFSPPPDIVVSTPVRGASNDISSISVDDTILPAVTDFSHISHTEELMELDNGQEERGPTTAVIETGRDDWTEDDYNWLDQTMATIGEDIEIETTEDDLLRPSTPPTQQIEEPEMEESTEPVFDLVKQEKCITYVESLLELVKYKAGSVCTRKNCSQALNFSHQMIGTALYVKWACLSGHDVGTWASQPKFKRMFAGNLQVASNILMTGNSYRKIALLFNFLNLGMISETTFYDVQRLYAKPAIERYWESMQRDLLTTIIRQGGEVAIAGDGRNDSPGYSAQYCTYVIVDQKTNAVLHLEIVDVRQTTSSPVMEKLGFQRAMHFLMTNNIKITEVVTDQNSSILKLMREDELYKGIIHQCDIWHAARNLEKRLAAAAKPYPALREWIPAIKNHFWWSAEDCQGKTLQMKESWVRLLCHVTNQHEWAEGSCSHGQLGDTDEERRPWLQKSSDEMETLRKVVTEPRFLKLFPYFRNYRHTSTLETFNSHLLMYCPKRISYQFPGYALRNLMAAIDHNHHLNLPQRINKEGEKSFGGNYSKRSKKWSARPNKIDKNYSYKWDLQVMVFEEKAKDTKPQKRKLDAAYDDPRQISRSIAKRPCPPIAELVRNHVSRMRPQTSDLPI